MNDLVESTGWRLRAACLDEDPELFFPVGNKGPALRQTADAKAVCFACPVRAECLRWALATREPYGVWGGMSETEREATWKSDADRQPAPRRTAA